MIHRNHAGADRHAHEDAVGGHVGLLALKSDDVGGVSSHEALVVLVVSCCHNHRFCGIEFDIAVFGFPDHSRHASVVRLNELDGRCFVEELCTRGRCLFCKSRHDVLVVDGLWAKVIAGDGDPASFVEIRSCLRCLRRKSRLLAFTHHPHDSFACVVHVQVQKVGIHAVTAGGAPSLFVLQGS